ncbi:SDR family NAD(P)-dependent oxidoreductase [Sporichthya polymorpha]|uniref:SDR family NAD(P)-dependent oxidoreductase n=1 Tax=Sporichthya polymorpha TaxID=35751 RepID=UPI000367C327|nr:SDR family NAD(P)-dependent oxidoreductase [Sporichthya polymorpha]
MRLTGKTAVITGAAGDLGRALAQRFAAEGVAGLVLSDRDPAALDAAADAVEGAGTKVSTLVADVSDRAAVDAVVDLAAETHGRLDVMINNAGVLGPTARIHRQTATNWRRVLDVNFFGALHGVESALRVMRPQRGGVIINTASIAGLTSWAFAAPYGVSKAAVIQLTKVAAVEYAEDKVRVNCVCPGVFPSAIHAENGAEAMALMAQRHPLGLGNALDVTGAFVYLAADESRWTTGAVLTVDGGCTAL